MDKLKMAIDGATVTIPYTDLKQSFASEADLAVWCEAFGLQFELIPETFSYIISKI